MQGKDEEYLAHLHLDIHKEDLAFVSAALDGVAGVFRVVPADYEAGGGVIVFYDRRVISEEQVRAILRRWGSWLV